MLNEADTCRKYVLPKLIKAGWDNDPHSFTEQKTFTDGRIIVAGNVTHRRRQKRADYLLRYTRDFMIAVVEAKAAYKSPSDGLQQAKEYAEILGLKFAYSTNGHGIIEFDYLTGQERQIDTFPMPNELWTRLRARQGLSNEGASRLLTPSYHLTGKSPRYYQEIAINRTVQSILQGKWRILLTMATGAGKTLVAFQICWKLWNARWNRTGEYRRPKILYLADRNILVDDPKDKDFAPLGDARWKIENGEVNKGRDMYFAIYQAIAKDERRPGLYREYAPDFFDLIIVDECHRGSARDESNWREILEYFAPAYQLGMTATPLREDNRDTYAYFGNPIYTYSLRQGIEDGFLAPYRVHRVISTWDAAGWRPSQGDLDRYGRVIPDEEYQTKDFERVVALRARTEAIAHHLTEFLKKTDRFAKTIVFCADQEHADEMRRALNNLNADLVQQYPDYVCRVTADEGQIGRGHLSRFQELETTTPVILTTSQLLTTGIDAQTCKNIVLARVINSMTDFKQIIGRGTRVRDDYGKLYFNILDYTGSATRLFADSDFDGDPALISEVQIDDNGVPIPGSETIEVPEGDSYPAVEETGDILDRPQVSEEVESERRKYYFDGGQVEIAAHLVYDLDRLPMLTWIMFLKFLDDIEQIREQEAALAGKKFRPAVEPPYRWRDWAAKEAGISGDELIAFVNNDEAVRPDGTREAGLFAYLRGLQGANGSDRRDVIATVFKGTINRMINGYLLRDVVNKVNGIHFTSSEEIHTLGHLYESMLKEMRDAAGDSGEFYTPRAVVRFMVEVIDPRLGETVLDPACGTGGFLVEAYSHLEKRCRTVQDREILQTRSLSGGEAKSLPYLLAQMNLLLHGLESPQIDPGNSLRFPLKEVGDKDRVDIILTNPPFGGEEERGILGNFPEDKQTSETALLFLQLIMRKLKRLPKPGRAGIVVPNGTLFGDGVCARIKEELLKEFNLHTIVRLPNGVFAPYTSIPTNLLFFDRSGPTKEIWYYEQPLPEGRKQYTKTQPLQYEEFAPCLVWWKKREENERAWKVPATDILNNGCNLDIKNPNSKQDFEHLPPEQLASDILKKEQRIAEIMAEIKAILGAKP